MPPQFTDGRGMTCVAPLAALAIPPPPNGNQPGIGSAGNRIGLRSLGGCPAAGRRRLPIGAARIPRDLSPGQPECPPPHAGATLRHGAEVRGEVLASSLMAGPGGSSRRAAGARATVVKGASRVAAAITDRRVQADAQVSLIT